MTQAIVKAPRIEDLTDDASGPRVRGAAIVVAGRAHAPNDPTVGSGALFWRDARKSVLVAAGKLVAEYMTFAAGVGFALFLAITRVPMRVVDRAFGLRLRDRFIDLIARISPG